MNYFVMKNLISAKVFSCVAGYFFKRMGNKVYIIRPLKISGLRHISIGDDVVINYRSWLTAHPLEGDDCSLDIGSGTRIGNFNHIIATKRIVIGSKVLTADKVYISDNVHYYEDIHRPVLDQGVRQIGEVEIGDGCWIGENAVILGAKIGNNCVVGSNAVVTRDAPPYCVLAGVPARIIKQYNAATGIWETPPAQGDL